jgi:hypothetical protein
MGTKSPSLVNLHDIANAGKEMAEAVIRAADPRLHTNSFGSEAVAAALEVAGQAAGRIVKTRGYSCNTPPRAIAGWNDDTAAIIRDLDVAFAGLMSGFDCESGPAGELCIGRPKGCLHEAYVAAATKLLCASTLLEEAIALAPAGAGGHAELTFHPGGYTYRGERFALKGKPLQVLRAIAEAPAQVCTNRDLHAAVWENIIVADDTVRSAVRVARKSLRGALRATGCEKSTDPIPTVDRGSGLLAWALSLP